MSVTLYLTFLKYRKSGISKSEVHNLNSIKQESTGNGNPLGIHLVAPEIQMFAKANQANRGP
jgi:hypothetical protein